MNLGVKTIALGEVADELGMIAGALTTVELETAEAPPLLQKWES